MAKFQQTEKYAEAARARGLPSTAFRRLGRTGWIVSSLGFGTYRVDDTSPEQAGALREALAAGCNLIDTSTNYTNGGSERAVGAVLRGLEAKIPGGKQGITVVSKVGYVQGANFAFAQAREAEGNPIPEMVKYAPDCWHCVHPDFIDLQLTASLERLGLPCLDVYLLHNPEYYFSDADARHSPSPLEARREEFYRRLKASFLHLEREVERGRILHYGVSSNTFGLPEEDTEFTSLTRMWEIAREISENHHFSVVQLPANLLERGAFINRNNGPALSQTVVELAQSHDIAVLVNRPLNAIGGNHLYRLADFPEPETRASVGDCLHSVAELEEEFVTSLGGSLSFRSQEHSAKDLFRWSLDLVPERTARVSPDQWAYLESKIILPQTHDLLERLSPAFGEGQRAAWNDWQRRYLTELAKLLSAIRYEMTQPSREVAARLQASLDPRLSEEAKGLTFSQKALATLAFTPGVSCVLNGMRRPAYVEDSLAVLRLTPWEVTPDWFKS
jgi:uncharacterized protein